MLACMLDVIERHQQGEAGGQDSKQSSPDDARLTIVLDHHVAVLNQRAVLLMLQSERSRGQRPQFPI